MCGPLALAGTSMAISGIGMLGQYQSANKQLDALGDQRRNQAEEINASAEQQLGERVRQGRRERARMAVAAGEAGAGGQSFEMQLANSLGLQNQDAATIGLDTRFKDRASQNRYASAVNQVDRPNLLTAGLKIGAAGASGYSSGLQIKNAQAAAAAGN